MNIKNGSAGIFVLIALTLLGTVAIGYFFISSSQKTAKNTQSISTDSKKTEKATTVSLKKAPLPGKLEGRVTYSFDGRTIANLSIKVTDSEKVYETKSDQKGNFVFEKVLPGEYEVTVNDPLYTLTPQTINIISEKTANLSIPVSLKSPKTTYLAGVVFEDKNSNGIRESNEPFMKNVNLSAYKESNGKKTLAYNIPAGGSEGVYGQVFEAPAIYTVEPLGHTFYTTPKAFNLTVDGFGGTVNHNFGYVPQVSTGGYKITVYNDKNENGGRDEGEESIHYQYAKVTNTTTGKTFNLAISEGGQNEPFADFGHYRVELIPEDSSWGSYYKITKGTLEYDVNATSPYFDVILLAKKLY